MGHVSNFPGVSRDPAAVPDFGDTSEFPTDDDIGRLLGTTGLDNDFAFLEDSIVDDCYRNANVLVPTNITSLIQADDEAHDKTFSMYFDSQDVLAPILQSDSFDIPCPAAGFDDNNESNGNYVYDKMFFESEKEKISGSSPEYSNEPVDNPSSNSVSEQSVDVEAKTQLKTKKRKKRKSCKKSKASTYLNCIKDGDSRFKKQIKHTTKKTSNHRPKEEIAAPSIKEESKTVPKLVIKFSPQDTGLIYKSESLPTKNEVFAPTIADKVKMGRRGQNGGINNQDFRKFLKHSEEMMKSRRRKKIHNKEVVPDADYESKETSPSGVSSYTSHSDMSPEYTSETNPDVSSPRDDEPMSEIIAKSTENIINQHGDHNAPKISSFPVRFERIKSEIDLHEEFDESILINIKEEEVQLPKIIQSNSNWSVPVQFERIKSEHTEFDEAVLMNIKQEKLQLPESSPVKKTEERQTRPVSLSMPIISDIFSLAPKVEIPSPDEVELGELPDVPIPVPKESTTKPPKVPSPVFTETISKRKPKVPITETKTLKSSRPVVPLKTMCTIEPKSEPPQRYSLPDTPLCSPSRSPLHQSYPGTSGSYSSRKRYESSSSSSTDHSSYERHRSPPSKRNKNDKSCQRCRRQILQKHVKYDTETHTLVDEFGRALRPSEVEEFKMSCHCSTKYNDNPDEGRRYSRTRSRDQKRKRMFTSRSRSKSSSRSYKYVHNGSRERSRRSPSIGNRGNRREKDRSIEERRVLYVGDLPSDITELSLRERFETFGHIQHVSIKHKYNLNNNPKYFAFLTFARREDAYDAKENGNKDPFQPKFDLNFGGRRKFCNGNYKDLDGNVASIEDRYHFGHSSNKVPQKHLGFEELLQLEKQRQRAQGLLIKQRQNS